MCKKCENLSFVCFYFKNKNNKANPAEVICIMHVFIVTKVCGAVVTINKSNRTKKITKNNKVSEADSLFVK